MIRTSGLLRVGKGTCGGPSFEGVCHVIKGLKMDLKTRAMTFVLFYLFVIFCSTQASNVVLQKGMFGFIIYSHQVTISRV